ncbi:MAG: hypothetical protein USCAAHI_02471 [Beijerinckiaceae bacterium]|nr:MAG: hypothetical protein USCAAHI_02471 [Beijerinckiaceae bacterium]
MSKQEKSLFMTFLMTPDMANFSGHVHGGTILKLLDQVPTLAPRDTARTMWWQPRSTR